MTTGSKPKVLALASQNVQVPVPGGRRRWGSDVGVSGQGTPGISGAQGPQPGRLSPDGGEQALAALSEFATAVSAEPPASNTGATFYGWDWSATTHDAREGVIEDLLRASGAEVALPGKGAQGWPASVAGYDARGYLLGQVFYGGGRDDVHFLATGDAAEVTRSRVVGVAPVPGQVAAKTARVDTRVDSLVPFEDLAFMLASASETYGSRVGYVEYKERGVSLGRTCYLGAPTSRIRVRVYEKWLESPGEYLEGTNRVEVQLRPDSHAKSRVSGWSPAETFCASKTTRDLAEMLGDDAAPKASVQIRRKTPDLEQTLAAMGHQYGKAVDRWLKASGGDVGKVLDYLV